MHASHQHQPLERGRSRTPKSTPIAMALGGPPPHLSRHRLSTNNVQVHSVGTHHLHRQTPAYHPPRRRPPPPPRKGKSPDRSEPGALEDAIHEAHARGDLRQCLQWVLELQGVYLDWDDPRLDTVTEDDLCFAESAGMGPNATPEERARAEKYWAMRQAEEDEARRVWELTATEEEKKVSRRLRAQLEAEQRKRDARAEYFRAPRKDKVATHLRQRPSPVVRPVVLSRSIESTDTAETITRRLPHCRQEFLFPFDEGEMSAVRTMWREQRRPGLAISETLVSPPMKESSSDVAQPTAQSPRLEGSDASDANTTPNSISPSSNSSGSAPSALFSSILTTTSIATSVSTVTQLSSPCSPSKVSSSDAPQAAMPIVAQSTRSFVQVPSAESPLHQHAASVALREALEEQHTRRDHRDHCRTQSAPYSLERDVPRKSRGVSSGSGWLRRGSRAVEGLVDLVSKLPTSYLPTGDLMETPLRAASCPPMSRIQPLTPSVAPETFIYLLPLKRPSYPRVFPPIPTLPRSPYRPLTPPIQPTPRIRIVSNPQFLRLKALQNRVLWGLVPVSQAECEALAQIERSQQMNAAPGRADVDRFGQMFTAKESMMRVAVDGLGRSALPVEASRRTCETSSTAALWSWWPVRL